jgi:hypothetical protein
MVLVNLAPLLLNELRFWARCFVAGPGRTFRPSLSQLRLNLGVYLAVIKSLPHVVAERRRVQASAAVSWRDLQRFVEETRSMLGRA